VRGSAVVVPMVGSHISPGPTLLLGMIVALSRGVLRPLPSTAGD
jgi:hypothetical protein